MESLLCHWQCGLFSLSPLSVWLSCIALAIVVASICCTGCLRFTSHLCTDPGTLTGLQLHVGAVVAFVLPLSLWGLVLCAFVSSVVSGLPAPLQLLLGALSVAIVATFLCCLFLRFSPDRCSHHRCCQYRGLDLFHRLLSPVGLVGRTRASSTPLSTSLVICFSGCLPGSCVSAAIVAAFCCAAIGAALCLSFCEQGGCPLLGSTPTIHSCDPMASSRHCDRTLLV
jgi:hypothetical protein